MSDRTHTITLLLELLKENYSSAQTSFILLEVFEQHYARKAIVKLASIFEILSDAVRKDDLEQLSKGKDILNNFAIQNYLYLCNVRIKQINSLDSKGNFFWFIFFLKNPLKERKTGEFINSAFESYDKGSCLEASIESRIAVLDTCFISLEQALAQIRPHKIYSRIISFILSTLFLIIGSILGIILLS